MNQNYQERQDNNAHLSSEHLNFVQFLICINMFIFVESKTIFRQYNILHVLFADFVAATLSMQFTFLEHPIYYCLPGFIQLMC